MVNIINRVCTRTFSSKPDPEVLIRIGRASELLQKETRHFLDINHTPSFPDIFDANVELRIQNSADDVLLRVQGEALYRQVYRTLRWSLLGWYGLQYRSPNVTVQQMTDPHQVRLRWKLEGSKRWSGKDETILAGHSYYYFDASGRVTLHIVDRIVPPATRGSWLWWYLERLRVGILPPKPLVGTSDNK